MMLWLMQTAVKIYLQYSTTFLKLLQTNFGLVKIGSGISVTGGVISVDGDTFDFDNYYTKTNLQTSGQSSVHWGNLKANLPH